MLPSRLVRFVTLLVAAIQFATPALASVAEGTFSRRVLDPKPHVEEYPQNDCTPPHGADCVVCRYLVDNVGHLEFPALTIQVDTVQRVESAAATERGVAVGRSTTARGPPASAS